MTPAPKRRWFAFSLRTLFVVVTVFACWVVYERNSRLALEAFDAAAWRDLTREGESRRLTMADGLVSRHELVGKTRIEVIEMLGEPPPPEYFRDWDMVYRLGMERGFISIDSEWLVIRLGKDGRVTDARMVRD